MFIAKGYIMINDSWAEIDGHKLPSFSEPDFESLQNFMKQLHIEHYLLTLVKEEEVKNEK